MFLGSRYLTFLDKTSSSAWIHSSSNLKPDSPDIRASFVLCVDEQTDYHCRRDSIVLARSRPIVVSWRKIVRGRRFVLLDRDGTLIRERHYLARVEDVELLPATARGLRLLNHVGLGLAVLTNQSGLSRGYFDETTLTAIHTRLTRQLAKEGVSLAGIYVCPHAPGDGCGCRKPQPGLALRAAAELQFDPATSFVIGDKPCDIELGRRLGATTFLVRTGYGSLAEQEGLRADYIVDDLLAAARIILERVKEERIGERLALSG